MACVTGVAVANRAVTIKESYHRTAWHGMARLQVSQFAARSTKGSNYKQMISFPMPQNSSEKHVQPAITGVWSRLKSSAAATEQLWHSTEGRLRWQERRVKKGSNSEEARESSKGGGPITIKRRRKFSVPD
ncbi:hypothetical protein EMCG_09739 [[Emmonsia] crescens]|uniref:Uncharacterized protein n=1 Tax=[Emmonsia] crescens TaxID=73230 RepID=A0A0G2I0Z9_9EURO|nr:hypothetical protein EMCG_09739 [Emmonsia crescens UAMH 3008]